MDLMGLKLLTNLEDEKDETNRLILESGKEFCLEFDTSVAGKGNLSAQVLGPDGRLQVYVEDNSAVTAISFTPSHEGDHYIHLFWRGNPLPISPLLGHCQGPVFGVDPKNVVLHGRGCIEGRAKVPAEFIIDGRKGGDGLPEVHLRGIHDETRVQVTKLKYNRYKCTYTAENAGSYLLYVNWSGEPIPMTPKKITIGLKGNVSLVKVTGKALIRGIAEQNMAINVNTQQAGPGYIEASCQNCNGQVPCDVIENAPGLYTINLFPAVPGQYHLEIFYDGDKVPGSPFLLRVGEPPDATQVKVWGPGIKDGILNSFESNFLVETQGAGVGQLSIKMKGPKGGFQVNTKRDATSNRTIVCWYEPTEAGRYVVNILWSGVQIPNSPFTVNIYETLEELQKATGKLIRSYQDTSSQNNSQWTEDI
ncbi:FLNA [Acanthosepion pharaonis]|uniref:FLNA n=1 Tax=Acanthosepion pharaonis TaxID=158019 RepID=A0A812BFZ7_ACAPH|nr:FLNA [Sepia pharaonis]